MNEKNAQEDAGQIRRILVALDASTHSFAALEGAAELAAAMQAELIGLFVEDLNLLHLAGLPFAGEVQRLSANRRPIDSAQMEQDLRRQASQARRALVSAAERVQVRYSFSIVRGQVTESVLEAALGADLLALGRAGWPVGRRRRLGSTARAASTKAPGPVLFMQQGSGIHYPVLVTFDGSQAARQALLAASRLAAAGGDPLNVLLVSDSMNEVDVMKEKVAALLADQGQMTVQYHWLPEVSMEKLIEVVKSAEDCVLVLGGDNLLLRAEAIQELLDETDCPVMLIR